MKFKKLYIVLFLLILLINCNSTNKKNNKSENKIEIVGTVKKIKAGAVGTFSQYTFFILDTEKKADVLFKLEEYIILFNKKDNVSRGFDEYIGKKVKITGKETIGFVGWRKEAKQGILVEKIEIIE